MRNKPPHLNIKKYLQLACCTAALTAAFPLTAAAGDSTDDTWAIYWYLCGSNLETDYGAATEDIMEMLDVSLPENVKVVIETGGAAQWQNEVIDPGYLERYVYDSEDLKILEQVDSASMGETETLADFLAFCRDNYPADHTAVIFWDHGGGSASGVAFDELYDYDSLTLAEIYDAFDQTFTLSEEEPPLDLVGFDACLMATVDTANTLSDISSYMVASEESEPGNGWYYTGWLGELAEDPSMDAGTLGTAICDSYMEGCEAEETEAEATLSVVDLGKLSPLLAAYENLGREALTYVCEDSAFFTEYVRNAEEAENYGGNTKEEGYTNMVDLKDLAEQNLELLPDTSQAVLDALDECVTYHVSGPYRSQSGGLSCYHSFNGDIEDFQLYSQVGASESFKYLYGYALSGELTDEALTYIQDLGYEEVPELETLEEEEGEETEYPVYVDDDGYAVMELDMDTLNRLKGVYSQLCYVDEEEDIILYLGKDNDISADWENGTFTDNFRDVWGAIDGYLCYMEIIYEGDDYNLYSIPIKLNGDECQLRVVYDYNTESFDILGAKKGLDENGMSDRNLIQLQAGDEITTLHYGMTISGDDEEFQMVDVDTFTVTESTSFGETDLGDGTFMMYYELVDARNTSLTSQSILFTVTDGEITTEVV